MDHPDPNRQEETENDKLPESLWTALGVPEPNFRDERSAPPVDHDVLTRLVRKEYPENVARAAYMLIHSFESWNKAYADTLAAEYHRTHGQGASAESPPS